MIGCLQSKNGPKRHKPVSNNRSNLNVRDIFFMAVFQSHKVTHSTLGYPRAVFSFKQGLTFLFIFNFIALYFSFNFNVGPTPEIQIWIKTNKNCRCLEPNICGSIIRS